LTLKPDGADEAEAAAVMESLFDSKFDEE